MFLPVFLSSSFWANDQSTTPMLSRKVAGDPPPREPCPPPRGRGLSERDPSGVILRELSNAVGDTARMARAGQKEREREREREMKSLGQEKHLRLH